METLIEKTRPKGVEFISKLSKELGLADDKDTAKKVLTSVLQIWRNNIPLDSAIQILTSLPPHLKEIYIIGWKPSLNPTFNNENLCFTDELIHHLDRHHNHKLSYEKAAKYLVIVLSVLENSIDESSRKSISSSLPGDIKLIMNPQIDKAA